VGTACAFLFAMQDANTYRQYAEECRKLAQSMPEHRASLLNMAAVWTDLAAKAETKEKQSTKTTK
jgi:ferric-dicitrate binding protein FerR (iron transport regulator)